MQPGSSVVVSDAAAYGVLCVQRRGRFGEHAIASPSLIQFGALTDDELFVSEGAATDEVRVTNESATEPLMLVRQFGPSNPDVTIDPLVVFDA